MKAHLLFVGVPYRATPTDVRDRVAGAPLAAQSDVVALRTCNRLELYAAVDHVEEGTELLVSRLARVAGLEVETLAAVTTVAVDVAAALHLCRVAAGLDSPILGDPEILGQVRAAAAAAEETLLSRVFAAAVRAGRRVRTETTLGERHPSLATVAAGIAAEHLGSLVGRRVVIVGAGSLGALVGEQFRACGCELVFVGRTVERPAALAARLGGRAAQLAALTAELAAADVLVSCTRSPEVVVTAAEVARAGGPGLVLDLAVPRDVEIAVGDIPACRLYDLDDVYERAPAPRSTADVAAAETIADEEAARFCAWRRSRAAAAAIAALHARGERIRAAELGRRRPLLEALSPKQRRAVETLTAQIVNKLLHEPTVRLKGDPGVQLVPVLEELFALEEAR